MCSISDPSCEPIMQIAGCANQLCVISIQNLSSCFPLECQAVLLRILASARSAALGVLWKYTEISHSLNALLSAEAQRSALRAQVIRAWKIPLVLLISTTNLPIQDDGIWKSGKRPSSLSACCRSHYTLHKSLIQRCGRSGLATLLLRTQPRGTAQRTNSILFVKTQINLLCFCFNWQTYKRFLLQH